MGAFVKAVLELDATVVSGCGYVSDRENTISLTHSINGIVCEKSSDN